MCKLLEAVSGPAALAPGEVMKLFGRPARDVYEPELVALAYAQLYDRRAGAIEIEIKEDKQGVVLNRGPTLARLLAGSLRELLAGRAVTVSLGGLSD